MEIVSTNRGTRNHSRQRQQCWRASKLTLCNLPRHATKKTTTLYFSTQACHTYCRVFACRAQGKKKKQKKQKKQKKHRREYLSSSVQRSSALMRHRDPNGAKTSGRPSTNTFRHHHTAKPSCQEVKVVVVILKRGIHRDKDAYGQQLDKGRACPGTTPRKAHYAIANGQHGKIQSAAVFFS